MTAFQIYEMFKSGIADIGFWGVTIIVILSCIQFSKIELHPLDRLMKIIGKTINKDLHVKIDELNKKVNKLTEELEKEKEIRELEKILASEEQRLKDAEDARRRFLRFNDEILTRSLKHSKESFDDILRDITLYTNYCKEHETYKNDKARMAIQNIRKVYAKCCEDKDFL